MKFLPLLAIITLLSVPFIAMGKTQQQQTVLIMLGAPGAGKGTQAVRLSDKLCIPHISTGDLFRANLKNQTPLGQKAKSYMDQGQLVPDELVLDMLFDRISQKDCAAGYILDGVPRTIPQAQALLDHLQQSKAQIIVISLEVPDEMIIERLSGRYVCEKCGTPYNMIGSPPQTPGICDRDGCILIQRKDDTLAVIQERLKVFHAQTEPVKGFFQEHGLLILIDGSVSKEETNCQIDSALARLLP